MQKIKFKIKGMHCNSCALLIEERLKDKPGIIKVRVSYEAQKAIMIYDETKITEPEIFQVIKEAGDYKIEKIEEKKDEEEDRTANAEKKEEDSKLSLETLNLLKILTSLFIFSLALEVVLIIISLKK